MATHFNLQINFLEFFSSWFPSVPLEGFKLLWLLIPSLSLLILSLLGVLVIVWLERKISAAAQQRVGPEFAGPLGLLQSLSDGLKLVVKEDARPAKSDPLLFGLGPALVVIPVLLAYAVVPFGEQLILTTTNLGIFFWIAVSSIAPIGLLMSGYASNNKYSFLGGLRATAQALSYEIPLALSILAVVLLSNTVATPSIVQDQSSLGLLTWNIWRQPIGFIVFIICALAECERLPFDLPEAEEELVAGYQTEYGGMKFALFYLGSYINVFVSSLFVSLLYLGGWSSPIGLDGVQAFREVSPGLVEGGAYAWALPILEIVSGFIGMSWMLLKAYFFIFLTILTRWTLPRVRIDQLLNLGWKFLLPLSLGNLLITAAFKLIFS